MNFSGCVDSKGTNSKQLRTFPEIAYISPNDAYHSTHVGATACRLTLNTVLVRKYCVYIQHPTTAQRDCSRTKPRGKTNKKSPLRKQKNNLMQFLTVSK